MMWRLHNVHIKHTDSMANELWMYILGVYRVPLSKYRQDGRQDRHDGWGFYFKLDEHSFKWRGDSSWMIQITKQGY